MPLSWYGVFAKTLVPTRFPFYHLVCSRLGRESYAPKAQVVFWRDERKSLYWLQVNACSSSLRNSEVRLTTVHVNFLLYTMWLFLLRGVGYLFLYTVSNHTVFTG